MVEHVPRLLQGGAALRGALPRHGRWKKTARSFLNFGRVFWGGQIECRSKFRYTFSALTVVKVKGQQQQQERSKIHDLLRMMPIYYCATRTVFAHEWFVNCAVAFRRHGAEGGGTHPVFSGALRAPILLVDDRSVSGFPSSFMEHDDALLVANYRKFPKDMLNKMAFCCFPLFYYTNILILALSWAHSSWTKRKHGQEKGHVCT